MKDDFVIETIKESIKEAVVMVGSQKRLAALSGLSQGAISKYVLGYAKPRGEIALRLEIAVDKKIHRSRFAPHIFTQQDTAV